MPLEPRWPTEILIPTLDPSVVQWTRSYSRSACSAAAERAGLILQPPAHTHHTHTTHIQTYTGAQVHRHTCTYFQTLPEWLKKKKFKFLHWLSLSQRLLPVVLR